MLGKAAPNSFANPDWRRIPVQPGQHLARKERTISVQGLDELEDEEVEKEESLRRLCIY